MKITIGNNEYEFVNKTFLNSRNWGHKSQLYKNGEFLGDNKSIYLNRTWEVYQFQSCMKGLLYNLIEEGLKEFITSYKQSKNIKRLSSTKRMELEAEFRGNDELFEVFNKF